nr:MAG TPA: hypothetical protein [Caudoviricetes sp.]
MSSLLSKNHWSILSPRHHYINNAKFWKSLHQHYPTNSVL